MSAKSQASPISQPYLLLGEGTGENEFFRDLLDEMGIPDVQVEDYGGKNKLAGFLKGLTIRTGFDQLQRIAVTRDADDDPEAAAASVRSAIAGAGFPEHLTVQSMILPGGGRKGALESLWLESLHGAPFEVCVKQFFACLQEQGWEPSQLFSKKDKGLAQVWLATKNPSNEAFHRASAYGRRRKDSAERWVEFTHTAFAPLREFLTACFA